MSLVQSSTIANSGSNGNCVPSLTGVAAGSLLVLKVSFVQTGASAAPTVSGWAAAQNPVGRAIAGGAAWVGSCIFYKENSAGGSESATLVPGSGATACQMSAVIEEHSGFPTSGTLGVSTSNNAGASTSGNTGTTGTTTRPNAMVAVAIGVALETGFPGTAGLSTPASSGYTSAGVQQDNSTGGVGSWGEFSYKYVTARGTQTGSWTWSGGSSGYVACVATFYLTEQIARPASDNVDGAWTPSTGTDLYATIDETSASDADYDSVNSDSAMKVNLGTLSTPIAGTQEVRFRAFGSAAKKLTARLIEGASTVRGSLAVDPLPANATDYVFSPSGIVDYADLDIEFETGAATSPPTLQVTWGAVGTGASGTTSCTPSYPSGISAATSKLFCVVTGRSNTADTAPTMPAGWTQVLGFEGGTGTWGVDTGTRRVTIFQKDTTTGSESGTVTVSLAGTTANTLRATIHRVEVPSGYGISVAASTGADTTNGTGYSATGSTNLSFQAGDLLLIAVAQNIDSGTQSAQSITASGITFGTLTNRASTAVTNGNDHRHIVDSVPVSSGSGTVAPTYAYTISASGSGPTGFLRLRAVEPTEAARVTWAEFGVPEAAPPAPGAILLPQSLLQRMPALLRF